MSYMVFGGVGHGGIDSGACANGVKESEINLTTALKFKSILVEHGVNVELSRTTDENDDLSEEIRECNSFNPTIALDIHNNAGGGDGFEAIYSNGSVNGLRLAKLCEKYVLELGQNSRGCKTRLQSNGKDYFGFVRETNCPAVIVEGCFIDSEDRFIADTIQEQELFGVAYAKACLEYLGIPYNGESINEPIEEPTSPSDNSYNIAKEVLGNRCKEVQTKLLYLGYDLGQFKDNGVFGNDTLSAIKRFQKDNGLISDGFMGNLSSTKLDSVYNYKIGNVNKLDKLPKYLAIELQTVLRNQKCLDMNGNTLVVDGDAGLKTAYALGRNQLHYTNPQMKGSITTCVQKIFDLRGYSISIDGWFGIQCNNATISFQKQCGLNQDGYIGYDTSKKLLGL